MATIFKSFDTAETGNRKEGRKKTLSFGAFERTP
jgi:hypothetical protein